MAWVLVARALPAMMDKIGSHKLASTPAEASGRVRTRLTLASQAQAEKIAEGIPPGAGEDHHREPTDETALSGTRRLRWLCNASDQHKCGRARLSIWLKIIASDRLFRLIKARQRFEPARRLQFLGCAIALSPAYTRRRRSEDYPRPVLRPAAVRPRLLRCTRPASRQVRRRLPAREPVGEPAEREGESPRLGGVLGRPLAAL